MSDNDAPAPVLNHHDAAPAVENGLPDGDGTPASPPGEPFDVS